MLPARTDTEYLNPMRLLNLGRPWFYCPHPITMR
jgi:hypothetical protein